MNRSIQYNSTMKFLTVIALVMISASLSFADSLRLIREKSFQMKDWQTVYVNASGAEVKVESWDKQEVYVKIFANSRAESKMQFDIYQESDVVKVIAKKRGSIFNWFGNNMSVRIEIMTPKNFNPHIETSGGDIAVKNLVGEFKLDTSGGDVTLTDTNGKLKVETSGGDIVLNKHKGNTDLSTSGGDIKCKETTGDLHAETSGGDITVDVTEGLINVSTSGGDISITYSGSNKGIEAETSGGTIRVKLPSNFTAKAHMETSGGEISNRFTATKSERVRRSELDAEFNGGGKTLKLETTGGDIIVDQK